MDFQKILMITVLLLGVIMSDSGMATAISFPPDSVAGWRQYWRSYVTVFVDPQGRVIDERRGGISTSEGQAYALFFSLVANQPQRFARILSWTDNNLAAGRLGQTLPGWLWGRNKRGYWTLLSAHSAADADLWLAYTLIEAGRLWHRPGYLSLGLQLADTIAKEEVVHISFSTRINAQSMDLSYTPMLLPGNVGFVDNQKRYIFNPSYMPLPILLGMAQADPQGPWQEMASQLPYFLRLVSPHGFVPDWVGISADGDLFTPPKGSNGSYNAIRVYLWAGMSDGCHDEKHLGLKVLHAIYGMRLYLQHAVFPPTVVNTQTDMIYGQGPVGFSAALLPYLAANHEEKALIEQLHRVRSDYDAQNGLLGQPAYYYDQNLALFAFGYLTKSFYFSSHGVLHTWWSSQSTGVGSRPRPYIARNRTQFYSRAQNIKKDSLRIVHHINMTTSPKMPPTLYNQSAWLDFGEILDNRDDVSVSSDYFCLSNRVSRYIEHSQKKLRETKSHVILWDELS